MKQRPVWRYRIALCILSPVVAIHLFVRTFKDGGKRYFWERLGFIKTDNRERVHVHAASVGEVITVAPLINALLEREPSLSILLTTNTPTGAKVAAQRVHHSVQHAYLPLDFGNTTHRFFKRLNITDCWIVETEIWPWLYANAGQLDIPITLINARLSNSSRGFIANLFHCAYEVALDEVTIIARSEQDAEYFRERGAKHANVRTGGNLKWIKQTDEQLDTELPFDFPYVLAASTHDNEEQQLAEAWLQNTSDGLLILAPRHPERGKQLQSELHQLQTQFNEHLRPPPLRSLGEIPHAGCRIYIADTLGEMQRWYAHATATFVGGSLIERGGHNVMEPVRAGNVVVTGPHTSNFEEDVALLKSGEAIDVANSAQDVIKFYLQAMQQDEWRVKKAQQSANIFSELNNVLTNYCELMLRNKHR